jgi:hypothetical protein
MIILSDERFSNVVTQKAGSVLELLWGDETEDSGGVQTSPAIPEDPEGGSEDDQTI